MELSDAFSCLKIRIKPVYACYQSSSSFNFIIRPGTKIDTNL